MSISALLPVLAVDKRLRWKVSVAGATDRVDLVDQCYTSDTDLVDACVAGKIGAFEALVEKHKVSVYHLCYRFVGNHEDSSDLSQEIFLRVHKGLRKFKGNSALATWIHRIGVNVCLSHVTAKKPIAEPIEPERYQDTSNVDPSVFTERGEQAKRVRAAIACLPKTQRATLILRIYQERSHKEIADILGSSVGAVKANFFHALSNMRKLLVSEQL